MSKNQTEFYKTRDLAESAALIVNGQKLTQVEKEGKVCWFIFEDEDKCKQISNQFFFGKLLVNAREYYEATARLKNRIFSI